MGERSRRVLRRALRALGRLGAAAGIAVTFAGATGVGLVLHVDTPTGRRATANLLSRLLSAEFQGKVAVGAVDRMTINAFTARDVVVTDPYGNRVLALSEVRARADVLGITYAILLGVGDLTVRIDHVRVENAEGQLIPDPNTGEPTIAVALTPKPTAEKPSQPGAPSRNVSVELPVIEVGHAFARGRAAENAPVFEARASGALGGVYVRPQGVAIVIQRTPLRVHGFGGADAVGTGEFKAALPRWMQVGFDGHFGDVQLNATTLIRGKELEITLDAPRARPEDVRALFADWPVKQDVALHVEAKGEPPLFQADAKATIVGQSARRAAPADETVAQSARRAAPANDNVDATVTAKGEVRTGGPNPGANLDVHGKHVDLRAFLPDAPATHVDLHTGVNVHGRDGQVVADVNGTTEPTEISGQQLPAIDVVGSIDRRGFEGRATAHERGMPVQGDVFIHSNGSVDFDAHAPRFKIQDAPRLAEHTTARGQAEARVKGHIEKGLVSADLDGNVRGLTLGDVQLGTGRVTGHAKGPIADLTKLEVDTHLAGNDFKAADYNFRRVEAGARGPLLRPLVRVSLEDQFEPSLQASGYVTTTGSPRIDDLKVAVSRDGATLEGTAKRLEVSGQNVDISGVEVKGDAGELTADLRLRPRILEAKVDSQNLDLDTIWRILGGRRGDLGGKLQASGEVSIGSDVQRGQLRLALQNGQILNVSGVRAELVCNLDQYDFSGRASAKVEGIGGVNELSWSTRLAGNVLRRESWRDIVGEARTTGVQVELNKIGLLLKKQFPELESLNGVAHADLSISRRVPAALPTVSLENAGVWGFELQTRGKNGQKGVHVRDVDLKVAGGISGETGDASGSVQIVYEGAPIASAAANSRLDLVRIVKQPSALGEVLLDSPFLGRFALGGDVQETGAKDSQTTNEPLRGFRSIRELPEWMRPQGIAGQVRGHVAVTGTLRNPSVSADLEAKQFLLLETPHLPVDLRVIVGYDVPTGRFGGRATVGYQNATVAQLTARGTARWQDLLVPPDPETPSWTGSAELELDGLPLGAIPFLADQHVNGRLYKNIVLIRQRLAPQVNGSIEVRNADIDGIPLGTGTITVRADASQIRAGAAMQQEQGGFQATFAAGLAWDELSPHLDESRPLRVGLVANDYDAAVLRPMLKDVLSELRGRLSGKLEATLTPVRDPKGSGDITWNARIRGDANMKGGLLQVAELGFELDDVSFSATAADQGEYTVIDVPNLVGRARSRDSSVTARAKLYLRGIQVRSAAISMDAREVPLVIEGVAQAYATASNINVQMARKPDEMDVTVTIPNLKARLPRSSERKLIDVEDNPAITLQQPLRQETRPRSTNLPWRVEFRLAEAPPGYTKRPDVRIERYDLSLPLTGRPVLLIRDKVALDGTVTLGGRETIGRGVQPGRVQLVGKPFSVESGIIDFDEADEPSNPKVEVRASWQAPDGTILIMHVHGRWRDAKIDLESDPPRSDQEKWALILGGRPSDQQGGGSSGSAATGLIEATKLNDLLAGTPLPNVEVRAEQTDTGNEAYTAGVRVSDTVWLEGTYTYRSSSDVNTANGQANNQAGFSGTVDWRFHPRWSVRTDVGTLGTGLDLLWQYRY